MSTQQIKLIIGGTDYTPYIDMTSVGVENNIVMTSDTAGLVMQLDGEVSRPRAGQEFVWQIVDQYGNEVNREFGGVVVKVEEDLDGASLIYTLTIKSYEHWFNRHLVAQQWYNQQSPESVVQQIVNSYCPGFDATTYVQTSGVTIIPQYFDYQIPSDCIKLVANQIGWGTYIDYWRRVHFYPAEFAISPLPNNILDVDNDTASYGGLVLTENGEQVYNKIILRGFKMRSSNYINLTFPGDAQTKQWSLGYRASSVSGDVSVAVFTSLTNYNNDTTFQNTGKISGFTSYGVANASGSVQMNVKRDIVDGAPDQASVSATAYIHYTQHLVRCGNWNGGNTALPSGYVLGVHLYYMKDQVFMGQDTNAQNTIAQIETAPQIGSVPAYSSDGVYEYTAQDKSLTNSTLSAVESKAELLVGKYGSPQITGSFVSYLSGWRAGQYFRLVTTKRMGGLSEYMYVMRVTKQIINSVNGGYVVQNTIEFANSPYLQ